MKLRQQWAAGVGIAGLAATAAAAGWKLATRRGQRRARRLHRMMVQLLLNALSAGDPVTARHSRRVADLTNSLARAANLARRERATLRVAALLHDMGKIEDHLFPLVHSARPLTDDERARIRNHPCESAHILAPLEKLHPGIARIVSSHHENWDGSGYPDGLAGSEIPLASRIISIADVFDALAQPRSYHEPRSPEDALEEVRKGAGTRFDPSLIRLLEEPEVRERWELIARRGMAAEREAQQRGEA